MSSMRATRSRSPLKAVARVGSPVAAESLKSSAGASLSMRTLRGHDRQPLDQLLAECAGGQRIALERQVRAMRLGRRADRDDDDSVSIEARLGFGPGQLFQPDANTHDWLMTPTAA